MLKNLQITDFRGFADLKLENLGKVNLIVGPNSAGKTSLLEAISITVNSSTIAALANLFRSNQGLGSGGFLRWLIRDGANDKTAKLVASDEVGSWSIILEQTPPKQGAKQSNALERTGLEGGMVSSYGRKAASKIRTISVLHKSPDELVESFTQAVRPKEGEQLMESLLKAVDPRIRSVRLDYAQQNRAPYIVVDMGLNERVPISQAGQGVSRLIAVFSELLGQRPEICMVDEIENGIYYLVLPQVWRGLAQVAETMNIQIFATTHSGECLEAAHEAFSSRPEYDLRVIQLYPVENRIEGRVLDKDLIQAAIDGDIDLR